MRLWGCHFVPRAAPMLAEWGRSAHGRYLPEAKERNIAVAVTEDGAPAFVDYDFKGPSRAACQQHHTSTGFANRANNPSPITQSTTRSF